MIINSKWKAVKAVLAASFKDTGILLVDLDNNSIDFNIKGRKDGRYCDKGDPLRSEDIVTIRERLV